MSKERYFKPAKELKKQEKEHTSFLILFLILLLVTTIKQNTIATILCGILIITTFNKILFLRIRQHQNKQYKENNYLLNEINKDVRNIKREQTKNNYEN